MARARRSRRTRWPRPRRGSVRCRRAPCPTPRAWTGRRTCCCAMSCRTSTPISPSCGSPTPTPPALSRHRHGRGHRRAGGRRPGLCPRARLGGGGAGRAAPAGPGHVGPRPCHDAGHGRRSGPVPGTVRRGGSPARLFGRHHAGGRPAGGPGRGRPLAAGAALVRPVFTRGGDGRAGLVPGSFDRRPVACDHADSPDIYYCPATDDGLDAHGIDGAACSTTTSRSAAACMAGCTRASWPTC